jgi:two-component system, NarL family, sensor histidine kinase ComP
LSIRKIFLFILSLIVMTQTWFVYVTLSSPFLGIKVEKNLNDQWAVAYIYEGGIAAGDLLPGDVILTIDSESPEQNRMIRKWHGLERISSIQVQRGNGTLQFDYTNGKPRFYDLSTLIRGTVCWVLAWIIWRKMGNSPSARVLAAVFLTGGVIFLSQGASIRHDPLGKITISIFMMILPVCFLQFLLHFFKEKSNIPLAPILFKIQFALYGIIGVGVIIKLAFFYDRVWVYPIYRFNSVMTLGFFTISLLGDIILLTYLYLKYRHSGDNLSSLIKTIWFALLFSFLPITLLSLIPQIFGKVNVIDAVYTSWFLLFFPASFAYLIASDQLYDIGLVLRRLLFGCILAVVPSALLTGLFTLSFYRIVLKEQVIFLFFACVLTLSLMLYFTENLVTRLETVFFPRRAMLKTSLKKISKNLSTVSTMRDLKDIFLNDIVQTLEVRGGAIVFRYPDSVEVLSAGEVNEAEVKELLVAGTLLQNDRYTCKEISHTEESTSYLVMTRKRTNVLLSKEERHWLGLITSYLEVSMENVHLIRTLTNQLQDLSTKFSNTASAEEFQWFRKVMFELQEEERIRIAADLHDTTMQDLFFLKRRFAALMERFAMNPEEKQNLDNILKFVDLINASLRQSCFELNPHLLREIGLVRTLNQYLEKETYTTPFKILFDAEDGVERVEQETPATKKHILRIVQELLNNAKKHSEASVVSFRFSMEGDRYLLVYEDNGVGIGAETKETRRIGESGIGLEQMKGRVLLLQGSFEVATLPQGGTCITIVIPVQEETEPKAVQPPHLRLV